MSEEPVCYICKDSGRSNGQICVVEEASEPSGARAGWTLRSHDNLSRALATRTAAMIGRANSSSPTPHQIALSGEHGSQHHQQPDDQQRVTAGCEQSPGSAHVGSPSVLSASSACASAVIGEMDRGDQVGDDVIDGTPGELGVGGQQHPVREDGGSEVGNVVGTDVVTSGQRCPGSAGAQQLAGWRGERRRAVVPGCFWSRGRSARGSS